MRHNSVEPTKLLWSYFLIVVSVSVSLCAIDSCRMSSLQLPLYRQLADHYLDAIRMGALKVGDRFPSVRQLMRTHEVSLSTALQTCRRLEEQGWLHARPRSGYYVQRARRTELMRASEIGSDVHSEATIDPANYVGIHSHVSEILARGQQRSISVNLALALGSPNLYPSVALNRIIRDFPLGFQGG
jgi:DNA-binding transcriptional MocR family regulator